MTTVSKGANSPGWRLGFHLIRPRFVYLVYLWLWAWAIPIPVVLFAPLVMLELFLLLGTSVLRRSKAQDPPVRVALQALEALRGQTWELRKMPPFVLAEVEVRPKALDAKAPQQVYLKIGVW